MSKVAACLPSYRFRTDKAEAQPGGWEVTCSTGTEVKTKSWLRNVSNALEHLVILAFEPTHSPSARSLKSLAEMQIPPPWLV